MPPVAGASPLVSPKAEASASDEQEAPFEIELWHPDNSEMLAQSLLLMEGVDTPARDLAESILAQDPKQTDDDVRETLVELVERIRAIQARLGSNGVADLMARKERPKETILRDWVYLDKPKEDMPPEPAPSTLQTAYKTSVVVAKGAWWVGTTAARWAPRAITAYKVVTTGAQIASSGHPLLALLVQGLTTLASPVP